MAKFNLEIECEDEEELAVYAKAHKMDCLIFELNHNFWRKWKHEDMTDEKEEVIEEVINELYALIRQYELKD